jgi:hypothetical protein
VQRLQLVASKVYLVPASLATVHVLCGGLSWTLLNLDADLGPLGAQAPAPPPQVDPVSFSQFYSRLLRGWRLGGAAAAPAWRPPRCTPATAPAARAAAAGPPHLGCPANPPTGPHAVQSASQVASDVTKDSITFYTSDLDYRSQQWQQAKSMLALLLIVLAGCIVLHAAALFVAWQFSDWRGGWLAVLAC